MKVFTKYFLFSSIILISVNSNLFATDYHENTFCSYQNNIEDSKVTNIGTEAINEIAIFEKHSDPGKINYIIAEPISENEEEDEKNCFRNYNKIINYFVSASLAQALGYFYSDNKDIFSQTIQFSFSHSYLYLTLEVFRL
jgi:hypothetical protein